ncbi:MAG: hypothetical protein V3W18_11080 [candidate division Zixibacteria bacterium]
MDLEELVAVSDFIGVVEVDSSEMLGEIFNPNLPKRGYWEYAQKNRFHVIEIIKSATFIDVELDRIDTLWAEKSFICAAASYSPGKYLVFLEAVAKNEWITINHQLGGIEIENDSVEFGWYKNSRMKNALISLAEAQKAINKCMIDSPVFEIEVTIPSDLLYNEWQENREYQKVIFHIYNPPSEFWPDGLTNFARCFIKISCEDYESVTQNGGNYHLSVHWENGYLIVDSIKPKGK